MGGCIVDEITASGTVSGVTVTETPLDAGTVSVQGPLGTYTLTEQSKGGSLTLENLSNFTSFTPPGAQFGDIFAFSGISLSSKFQ